MFKHFSFFSDNRCTTTCSESQSLFFLYQRDIFKLSTLKGNVTNLLHNCRERLILSLVGANFFYILWHNPFYIFLVSLLLDENFYVFLKI